VTQGRDHDGVLPGGPLALATLRNITGHTAHARVIKLSSHNSSCAGLTVPAGLRRCGRCYALTFHDSNGLLKPLIPRDPTGNWGYRVSGSVA